MKNSANSFSNITIELFLSVFWSENNMILAFSFNMSHTLPILHNILLFSSPFGSLPQGVVIFFIRWIGKAFSSLTAVGRGFLKLNYTLKIFLISPLIIQKKSFFCPIVNDLCFGDNYSRRILQIEKLWFACGCLIIGLKRFRAHLYL